MPTLFSNDDTWSEFGGSPLFGRPASLQINRWVVAISIISSATNHEDLYSLVPLVSLVSLEREKCEGLYICFHVVVDFCDENQGGDFQFGTWQGQII
jgi:hypothetical protein